jgi:hypothetical protein
VEVSIVKKVVPVSGNIVGEFMEMSMIQGGLLIIQFGAVVAPSMPSSIAELAADALVRRGRQVGAVPAPDSRAGRN